jgi:hypothetical protein
MADSDEGSVDRDIGVMLKNQVRRLLDIVVAKPIICFHRK